MNTNTKIDIGEDGSVFISATNGESAKLAVERVEISLKPPWLAESTLARSFGL